MTVGYGIDYWADWLRMQASHGRRAGLDFVRISVQEADAIAASIEDSRRVVSVATDIAGATE